MLVHISFPAHAATGAGLVFLSGQVPVDRDGKIVDGGIKEHTVSSITDHILESNLRMLLGAMSCKPE